MNEHRVERRPGPTVRVRVEESTGTLRRREDRVVAEEPLEIRLATPHASASSIWVTMRTPGHDFELAAGFCVHEGIASPGDIAEVAYCTDEDLSPEQEFNVVTLTLRHATDTPLASRHAALSAGSSACGVCGKDSVADALRVTRGARWTGPPADPDVVRLLPQRLRAAQPLFEATGGTHAAGLFDAAGDLLVAREDVGRHNAVDKAVGARVLAGADPACAYLTVSGRAGFELVQKAVSAGCGALVAVGAPTSLSVRLAREAGLGLFGFVDADRCVRYA